MSYSKTRTRLTKNRIFSRGGQSTIPFRKRLARNERIARKYGQSFTSNSARSARHNKIAIKTNDPYCATVLGGLVAGIPAPNTSFRDKLLVIFIGPPRIIVADGRPRYVLMNPRQEEILWQREGGEIGNTIVIQARSSTNWPRWARR